jgi:hypothetical protein
MGELPHDGETASVVRGKETETFYFFNADLVYPHRQVERVPYKWILQACSLSPSPGH